MFPSSERRFLAINYISIWSLFILILAGGVVRSSGSGMGCPDWPRCFDRLVPPTSQSQLPNGYQDEYVSRRVEKNERFAAMLDGLGFGKLALRIRNDESILQPEEFNAGKTWTEYVNRLIGAVTGLFLLACAIFSVTYLRSSKRIFFLSVLNLVLVGFQGWLGSVVVSTNLLSWTVTVHMVLALVILAISIYTFFRAKILRDRQLLASRHAGPVKIVAALVVLLSVGQIILGTDVREEVDMISSAFDGLNRSAWVSKLGSTFVVHRNLAAAVLVSNMVLFVLIRTRYPMNTPQFRFTVYTMTLILLQIVTGVVLAYFGMPAAAQTVHLFIASLMFGSQYYLLLLLRRSTLYKRG